jgi:cyclase
MLRVRVIPVLLLREGRMVKTKRFAETRDVGDPVTAARVYDAQGADELIFLDIDATAQNRPTLHKVIERVSEECFMPLAVGGGVRTVDDARRLLAAGADKVVINTAAAQDPEFVDQVAEVFGDQCVVVSMDARKTDLGYEVYTNGGKRSTGLNPRAWAKDLMRYHVGEILVTSIENEGLMQGYDLNLVRTVAEVVNVPVIAHGGCGTLQHFVDAIQQANASAVAAASLFHFTDQSPIKAHAFMSTAGIPVRTIYT